MPVGDAEDIDPRNGDRPIRRRRDAERRAQRSPLRSVRRPAQRDLVAFRDHVVDRDTQIQGGSAVAPDPLLARRAVILIRRRAVIDVVRREQLVEQCKVSLVVHLFDEPPDQGLVRLNGHANGHHLKPPLVRQVRGEYGTSPPGAHPSYCSHRVPLHFSKHCSIRGPHMTEFSQSATPEHSARMALEGCCSVLWRKWRATVDEDGALLLRRAAMMPRPATRPNRQSYDTLRLCTTPRRQLPSDFTGWSGYPSIAALSINPGIDVMCQKLPWPLPRICDRDVRPCS